MGKLVRCFSSDEMINKVFISGNIVFLLMSLTDSQFSPFKMCNKTSCFATFLKSKTVLKCWAHRRLNFVAKDKWWLSLFQAPSSILSSLSFLLEKQNKHLAKLYKYENCWRKKKKVAEAEEKMQNR